ncbi:hypothetical protein BD779DRAFT_1664331 [Infundibulicybe gibba]|nr:hypothetical protein BD779DRAFT_1664331 [Infundibulicybe gibba]
MIAAAATTAGSVGTLLLHTSFGMRGIIANILIVLALASTSVVVAYQNKPPEPQPSSTAVSRQDKGEQRPESAKWLNALLHSVWPIVNPALFVSIADMLEDALQATLPKLVHGVRVADIGQGSESIRILGIRWLDPGQAAVEKDGMAAEEGDFFNLEVAVAYRGRSTASREGLKGRSGNAHMLLQFWVAGGVMLPVWVELMGFLSTMRLRLQLTPNPPFLSLMTLTLLGQPKVSVTCTPLTKNFLNVMDIPGLSKWLQSSIDRAVAEPKLDTDTMGVVIITIKTAHGFKDGDGGRLLASKSDKRGDLYVTVGWSKWGKPLWSTRIIQHGDDPIWEETTAILVGPPEVNAQEQLRVQLWDSDRMTADDTLGIVNLPLKDLMTNSSTLNTISIREDQFTDASGSPWPGKLSWEKLREAVARDHNETGEIEQQKKEDLKERSEEVIAGSKPAAEWPSGIVAVRIEQINGLEGGEDEEADDLPSAYCTVIVNHERVYKTRVKVKSNKPFFDANTEKFIRDWRTSTIIIAVRDSRMHEVDPLLGVVVLPLAQVFKHNSHIDNTLPLVGGIGYGRMKFSLNFRSVQAQLPSRLLGWNVGTLDIDTHATASTSLPPDLASCRLMVPQQSGGWSHKRGHPVRLAVTKRYASCLLVQFRKHKAGPDLTAAFGTLWLKDVPDGEDVEVTLPVWNNTGGALKRARINAGGEYGERVDLADKDMNMADVMEALDCAEESEEVSRDLLYDDEGTGSSTGTSSSESGTSDGEKHMEEVVSGGLIGEVANYRKRKGELHRKHRGLMQWRAARNVAWVGRNIESTGEKLVQKAKGKLHHQNKEAGIEKESSS